MKTMIRYIVWPCAIILILALTASAQTTNTWNGGGADDNWTTAGNWLPGAPNAGDSLIFDGATRPTPNNDFAADTGFGGIQFAPIASAFTLGGNRIAFAGLVENATTNTLQTIALPLLLTNATTFNTISNDDTTTDDLQVIGLVSGTGSLTKTGGGTLFLSNASHSGGTTVSEGALVVSNNIGNVTVGGGSYIMNFRTYFINPTISLTADSRIGVDLPDNTEPVGVDIYSTIGTSSYKFTKVGEGLLRSVGTINASSIDVATGTLGSLGGGIGGSVSIEPLHKLGTAPITVENGAMLRIDDGGVVQNAITLNGTGTATGGSANTGALRSSSRNNGGSTTNFNYFTNTITLASDSTIGTYYNTTYIPGNITGPAGFTKIGGNPLNISGSNDFSGSVTLNAGTLQLGSSNAIPPTASVTLNGISTLDLNGNSPSLAGGLYDDASGNGNVDNSSVNPVTVSLNGATLKCAFKNTGGGPLSIVNVTGSTTLTGANTFSGGITLQSGSLETYIPNSASNGLVSVADGTMLTLDFQAPGGSMKPNGVTLAGAGSGVTLNFNLNFYGTSSKPILNTTNGSGILTANGTTTITFVNSGNLNVGQYPLIKYNTRAGTGNFVLTAIPGIGATIVTNAVNNSIDLKVTSAPIVTWKGKVNNNLWDMTTTNWTYNGSPVLYADSIPIYFDDTALTNNVNLTTTVSPGTILVNTTNTYTFGGSGPLNGGILTKNGTGTLVMDVSGNGYSSTLIGSGALQVGANDTFGDLGSGAVDDEGSLAFNRSDNFTFGNTISGLGAVVQNNTNITTLSVANSYSGGTVVNQGVLKAVNNLALGYPSSSTLATVASGASLDVNGRLFTNTQYAVISGTGAAAAPSALFISGGGTCIGCGQVGVRYLSLAGNASIGGSSGDFQIGADHNLNPGENQLVGSLAGNNFALTKVGNSQVYIEVTNASPLSQVTVAAGGLLICGTATTPFGPNCPIVVSNNAFIDTWDQFAQKGITFANPITIGAGGGQLRNTHGSYGGNQNDNYNGPITLNDTLTTFCTYSKGQMFFNGTISGTGGIVNSGGSRPVTLVGAMNYTGLTLVSNLATLQLSANQQGGGAYVSADTATLDVINQSSATTLPMSALTLGSAAGTTLTFGRVSTFSTNNALIMATNLTLVGANSVLLPPSIFASPGQYPLIKFTGSISGGGSLVVGASGARGVPASIVTNLVNNSLDLVVPGGNPVYWTGSVNNGWDIASTANFKYLGAGTTYQQSGSLGDAVTFDDSSTKTNVTITTPVSPSVIIANLTNNTYVFAGTNITGASSLVKNGPGTLVLSNLNNNYTAGTFVGAGTLKLATAPGPSGPLNSLSSGTVTVATGASFDMGSNNPSALIINASGAGVSGNGAVQANYSGSAQAFGPSIINQIGNLTVGGNNRWDLRNGTKAWNVNSNGATLTKVGSGYIGLVAATISTNLGDITILGGTLDFSTTTTGVGNTNATIYVGNGGNLGFFQFATPVFKSIICSNNAGILVDGGNTVGQNVISGPFVLQGGTTTIKGNFFNGLYVSNAISGPGSLGMQFQSYLYLAASNTFTGTLTVPNCNASNGGRGTRLSFIGNGSAMTCSQIILQGIASGQAYAGWISMDTPSATMTLGANQLFRGDNGAYVRGSVVAPATSMIAPGGINNSNYQYMIIGTNLTYQAGSTNYMDIYKAGALLTNDLIIVSNLVTYAGTLQIRTNGPTALVVGDSFKLYQATSVSGNFNNIADDSGTSWSFNPATGIATVTALAPTVNTNRTNIVVSVTGNLMTMQWPADHIGWFLQSNSVGLANTGAWFNVTGSDTTNKINATFDSSKTNVFYRMKY